MTQKELLYVEDAIGHEASIISIINESITAIDDEKIIKHIKNDLKKHEDIKNKLINLLEVKSNE